MAIRGIISSLSLLSRFDPSYTQTVEGRCSLLLCVVCHFTPQETADNSSLKRAGYLPYTTRTKIWSLERDNERHRGRETEKRKHIKKVAAATTRPTARQTDRQTETERHHERFDRVGARGGTCLLLPPVLHGGGADLRGVQRGGLRL